MFIAGRMLLTLGVTLAGLLLLPSSAGALVQTQTFRVGPIEVEGYEVLQASRPAPTPQLNGHVTRMEADITDAQGNPVPIERLMLHHIVFTNLARADPTCASSTGFDGQTTIGRRPERFYAAGEERAKLTMPPGYGYRARSTDPWGVAFMVMNHRATAESAYIQYTVTIDTDPNVQSVDPYWFDVENCRADPIYNVPGTGEPGSTHRRAFDFAFPQAGRIVGGGGHTHGGARRLTLTQPACDNREVARSVPTWGRPDHPFYNVRPILHEPGPVNMTAFTTEAGIPIEAGQTLRLNSEYENSRPHTRVMGISVLYFAPDASVADGCGPLPGDLQILGSSIPGRHAPPRFSVPLTDLDANGQAVSIKAPPGRLEPMRAGGTVKVGDRFFSRPNLRVEKGAEVNWRFVGNELHNLTLANGPVGIGSPNLNAGRVYSRRLTKSGTYRFFCGLHPVDMQQRIVVDGTR